MCDLGHQNALCSSPLRVLLFVYASVRVAAPVCVCPEDRAVTEVNGAVSVCNVILTVSLAQTKHRGTVGEIKLGLFYCL